MSHQTLEGRFGRAAIKYLKYPKKVFALNGTYLTVDSYEDAKIEVKGKVYEERIYLSKDFVKKVVIEESVVKLPELIVGVSTIEAWGIEIDLKNGDVDVKGIAIILGSMNI